MPTQASAGDDRRARLAAAVAASITAYLEAEAAASGRLGEPLGASPVRPADRNWVLAGRVQAMQERQLMNPRKG